MTEPEFAFGKRLGIADGTTIPQMVARLIACMRETNKIHGVECEFFRLDYRQPYFDETFEFPLASLILDMKWGCKREFESKQEKS